MPAEVTTMHALPHPGAGAWRPMLLAIPALLSACTTSPTGRSQLMLISPESAIVESKKAYLSTVGQLDRRTSWSTIRCMADRVATITGRLVTEAIALYPQHKDWEWSVAIIDDDETVNAWCMAGVAWRPTRACSKSSAHRRRVRPDHGPRDLPRPGQPHGGAHVPGHRHQHGRNRRRRRLGQQRM
jgi:hypothetical protein